MTTAQLETLPGAEDKRIARWRLEQLRAAGYDPAAALKIAGQRDIDLHLAVDLLRRGCPPETALRILL